MATTADMNIVSGPNNICGRCRLLYNNNTIIIVIITGVGRYNNGTNKTWPGSKNTLFANKLHPSPVTMGVQGVYIL